MNKILRGLKVAAMLLSLLTVGIAGVDAQTTDCGCSAPTQVVYTQPTPVYSAPVSSCGCNRGCTTCQKKVACPQCDCQFCELDVKKGEVEKTCFKTEQKEVCIPAVRLPWKKCCPPKRSKVRTVNVLKKHKYKCPECQYKWNVHEPEDFDEPTAAKKNEAEGFNASEPNSSEGAISIYPDPADAMGDVPRPPMEE